MVQIAMKVCWTDAGLACNKKKETYVSMYKLYGWAILWIEAQCLLNCQRKLTCKNLNQLNFLLLSIIFEALGND